MKILVACEESQTVCKAFRNIGHQAFSCDILPCSGGHPEWHYECDVREIINLDWDMVVAHPDCTYLTVSAEWAYKEPPYHQRIKTGTLVGASRIKARAEAVEFAKIFWMLKCKVAIENPIGVLSRYIGKPSQIIQPYQFGHDASKSTCLWLKGLPNLKPTCRVNGRIVNGVERWSNQTDSGQNKLPPSEKRRMIRSKTYEGIAEAMANQWG